MSLNYIRNLFHFSNPFIEWIMKKLCLQKRKKFENSKQDFFRPILTTSPCMQNNLALSLDLLKIAFNEDQQNPKTRRSNPKN